MRPKGAAVSKQQKDRNAAPQPAWEQRDRQRSDSNQPETLHNFSASPDAEETPHRRAAGAAGEGLKAD